MTCKSSHFSASRVAYVLALALVSNVSSLSCAEPEPSVGSRGVESREANERGAVDSELTDSSWVVLGFFPGEGDELLQSVADVATMECCEYALDDESFSMSTCVNSLFSFYVPRMQWLACATRLAEDSEVVSEYLGDLTEHMVHSDACNRASACRIRECQELEEPELPAALEACPDRNLELCPDGNGFSNGVDCNGVEDCSDGYDEQNCPPSPAGFSCGDGGQVPWASLCDGVADCDNRVDESTCFPRD